MSRRTLLIIIFVSLALNLFLIGGMVGGLVVGQRLRAERPPAMARMGGPPVGAAAAALSPEHADAYRAMLRQEGSQVRTRMRAARDARLEAWRSLGADPFDPAVTKERLAAIRLQEVEARSGIDSGIVEFAAGLPAAERAKLAKALTERPRRGPDGGEGGGHKGGGPDRERP